jgi:hypothetical protein
MTVGAKEWQSIDVDSIARFQTRIQPARLNNPAYGTFTFEDVWLIKPAALMNKIPWFFFSTQLVDLDVEERWGKRS